MVANSTKTANGQMSSSSSSSSKSKKRQRESSPSVTAAAAVRSTRHKTNNSNNNNNNNGTTQLSITKGVDQQQSLSNGKRSSPGQQNNNNVNVVPVSPSPAAAADNKNSGSSTRGGGGGGASTVAGLCKQKHNTQATASAAAAATSSSSSSAEGDDTVAAIRRHHMKEAFQPWVMQTYGDAAKTKTISRRKAERIGRILRGHDRSNGADSSKFRFWVRAKGFRLGPPGSSTSTSSSSSSSSLSTSSSNSSSTVASPSGNGGVDDEADDDAAAADDDAAADRSVIDDLYVVTSTAKDEIGCERPVYKRVAVVEDFFDIIYREHVEFQGIQSGRVPTSGKHAGQKRTYRAITEIYAFLPREAVTRFLMQCADCQRRGGGGGGNGVVSPPSRQLSPTVVVASSHHHHHHQHHSGSNGVSPGSPTPPASPASLGLGLVGKTDVALAASAQTPPLPAAAAGLMLALSAHNIDLSLPLTSTLIKRAKINGVSHRQLLGLDRAESSFSSADSCFTGAPVDMPTGGGFKPAVNQDVSTKPINVAPHSPTPLDAVGLVARRVLSPVTLDLSSKTGPVQLTISSDDGQHSPMANDDDDDDDDTDDRIDLQVFDPERLKAFNMFVRLFVDENLDRIVPISRQPREKIQAIIDSCLRQFPEFGERARKRIRTYLKSCRRNKRPASDAGLPSPGSSTLTSSSSSSVNRPMPPHLTSPAAEQILAQACENENQNAKRLRLGLEPISQPLPANFERPASRGLGNAAASTAANTSHSPSSSSSSSGSLTAVAEHHRSSPTTAAAGSNQLFRPAFGPYQRSSTAPQTLPILNYSGATLPTDLSTKPRPAGPVNGLSSPSSGGPTHGSLPHKLNTAEMLAVRQLITGYRESAAFLLRSADELEQLLHIQHSPSN